MCFLRNTMTRLYPFTMLLSRSAQGWSFSESHSSHAGVPVLLLFLCMQYAVSGEVSISSRLFKVPHGLVHQANGDPPSR